jgi:hypothetical protein
VFARKYLNLLERLTRDNDLFLLSTIQNKLECFTVEKFCWLVYFLGVRIGAYPYNGARKVMVQP